MSRRGLGRNQGRITSQTTQTSPTDQEPRSQFRKSPLCANYSSHWLLEKCLKINNSQWWQMYTHVARWTTTQITSTPWLRNHAFGMLMLLTQNLKSRERQASGRVSGISYIRFVEVERSTLNESSWVLEWIKETSCLCTSLCPPLSASWMQTQCDQLPHHPVTTHLPQPSSWLCPQTMNQQNPFLSLLWSGVLA